uniref:ATP synthase F0 subunit 8 n=1 Tax=Populicerus populi TaxID=1863074 RepID=A0A386PZ21_9HEMI|nr:ATP synthase F0 subunit 8 [Populicerus populi]AYE40961.1 ATP synthase F0 subunit 8 [Populicerus populi]
MPQMSPIWWLTLMLTFNLFYLMMNTIMYFNYKIKSSNSTNMTKLKLNWKW